MKKRIEPRPRPPDGPNDICGAPGGMYPYDGTMTYFGLHVLMGMCVRTHYGISKYPLSVDQGPPQKARSDKLWRRK